MHATTWCLQPSAALQLVNLDFRGQSCRHIQAHASSCSESGVAGGTIRQSFCSALQAELAEFYHLMAVLQEQSLREAPKPDNLSTGMHQGRSGGIRFLDFDHG